MKKDPLFLADSVFLKSPRRIEAMAMLMGLCLMVYSLGQREVRRQLSSAKTGIPNQLGKLTARPTLRWIFQCFQGIHYLSCFRRGFLVLLASVIKQLPLPTGRFVPQFSLASG